MESTLRSLCSRALGALLLAGSAAAQFTADQIPVHGGIDAWFLPLDQAIQQEMANASPQVTALSVAVMKNGRVMYQRAFGWRDGALGSQALLPTDRMRVASVTKPVTAAAIWRLLEEGVIDPDDRVFEFGQTGGETGILPASEYFPESGVLGDASLPLITVWDLLLHRGGWTSDVQFNSTAVTNALGGANPAGIVKTVRYMMEQPLGNPPGTVTSCPGDPTTVPNYCYSNFGFLLLGLIIEEVTDMPYMDYVESTFLSQWGGSPIEVQRGRGLKVDQDPTEPLYESTSLWTSVYPPYGQVSEPYGRWEHEVFLGHGDLIMTPLQMVHFASRYVAFTDYPTLTRKIGQPLNTLPPGTFSSWGGHLGSIPGSYAYHMQKGSSGTAYAFVINQRDSDGSSDAASAIGSTIQGYIDNLIFWPTKFADDTWVDHTGVIGGDGKYTNPFTHFDQGLAAVQPGGRLKLVPGDSSWAGVINTHVVLEGPLGAGSLGKL